MSATYNEMLKRLIEERKRLGLSIRNARCWRLRRTETWLPQTLLYLTGDYYGKGIFKNKI